MRDRLNSVCYVFLLTLVVPLFLLSACGTTAARATKPDVSSAAVGTTLHTPVSSNTPATSVTDNSTTGPGTTLLTYREHRDTILVAKWSPDGKSIASSGNDGALKVWDARTGRTLWTHQNLNTINTLAWSPDGKRIAIASSSRFEAIATVWDVATGKTLVTYRGSLQGFTKIVWSPNGKCIATANGNEVQIWDATTGKTISIYHGHPGIVDALAWSPDGKYIASAASAPYTYKSEVHVWDAETRNVLMIYHGHPGMVLDLNWSPDSTRIVSADHDKDITLVWNATSGKTLLTYHHFSNGVAWSHNGKYIVSASNDKTAQIWDATTGKVLLVYRGHTDSVCSAAWSPDDREIATGSGDQTVRVWLAR